MSIVNGWDWNLYITWFICHVFLCVPLILQTENDTKESHERQERASERDEECPGNFPHLCLSIHYIRKLISVRYILFMNDAYHLQAFYPKMPFMVMHVYVLHSAHTHTHNEIYVLLIPYFVSVTAFIHLFIHSSGVKHVFAIVATSSCFPAITITLNIECVLIEIHPLFPSRNHEKDGKFANVCFHSKENGFRCVPDEILSTL